MSWDWEEEKKAKVKQRKWGSGVLPGSFVNTLQTLFVAEHFLQSTQPSLHDSRVRRTVRLCAHQLVKYSYIGCVPGELARNVIAELQSDVLVCLCGPVFSCGDSLYAQVKTC